MLLNKELYFILGPHLRHMEVPRLSWGQIRATLLATAAKVTANRIQAASSTYTTGHDKVGSLTYWVLSKARDWTLVLMELVGFVSTVPRWGTPPRIFTCTRSQNPISLSSSLAGRLYRSCLTHKESDTTKLPQLKVAELLTRHAFFPDSRFYTFSSGLRHWAKSILFCRITGHFWLMQDIQNQSGYHISFLFLRAAPSAYGGSQVRG